MDTSLVTLTIRNEQDVVRARQRARQVSGLLGFDAHDQVRIATAVSEIARNAFSHAGGGEVEFLLELAPPALAIEVRDSGPGIHDLDAVLLAAEGSSAGLGLGLRSARRLMDDCRIVSDGGGTRLRLVKRCPAETRAVPPDAARIAETLGAAAPLGPLDEVEQQNRELIRAYSELTERQSELSAVNRELEDTNRGVVALYAELEARADYLRRADEMKSRFLSNLSHEFRTPLNSIRALTDLLLARSDGELSEEQAVQVAYIRKGADELTQLVDDLLDLAKIEAGKIDVRPSDFTAEELFGALRGMLRPLATGGQVALRFVADAGLPRLYTDEAKLSQILRNFVSNALKFTEHGEVRITARRGSAAGEVVFAVADTGIGIALADQQLIFEEFEQVPNALQRRVKGTGLGLPLCRRLATLLGGRITLESTPGVGSTFAVILPCRHAPHAVAAEEALPARAADRTLPATAGARPARVLVIEDDPALRYLLRTYCEAAQWEMLEAADAAGGLRVIRRERPDVVVLDLGLPDRRGEDVLAELADDATTRSIPVVVATSEALGEPARCRLGRSAAVILSKRDLDGPGFVAALAAARRAGVRSPAA